MKDEIKSGPFRLFIGLPVAERVQSALTRACYHFQPFIQSLVPMENWHITLVWLGEVAQPAQSMDQLLAPVSQSFVPTISITHVGRGAQPSQLWAYVTASPALLTVRQALLDRLTQLHFPVPSTEQERSFIPHIRLANLQTKTRRRSLADYFVCLHFSPPQAHLYQSLVIDQQRRYLSQGSIVFTP